MHKSPPEELDTQVPDKQSAVEFQLFTSLLRVRRGWFANHALQRTRPSRSGCKRAPSWAGSLDVRPHHTLMPANLAEIKRREAAARAAIKEAFGTPHDEFGATMFVSHHLEELDSAYWKKHFSTARPDAHRILDALVLRSHWGGDDEIDTFDFTLPEEVTQYVVSVAFDEDGSVSGITMES